MGSGALVSTTSGWDWPQADRETRAAAAKERTIYGFMILLSLRSEEHTSELQSLMRISYAVFCLKKIKSATYFRNAIAPDSSFLDTYQYTLHTGTSLKIRLTNLSTPNL